MKPMLKLYVVMLLSLFSEACTFNVYVYDRLKGLIPTETPVPTSIPAPTATPTATPTTTVTPTATPVATPTPTATSVPTATPTPTPVVTLKTIEELYADHQLWLSNNSTGAQLTTSLMIINGRTASDLSSYCTGLELTSPCNLTEVDLSGTVGYLDLPMTYLTNANLSGTTLRTARGSQLDGANLANAILAGGNFSYANIGYNFSLSGKVVDLSNANFTGAGLNNLNMSLFNVTGTILKGASLQGSSLLGANLSGKDLTGTNFSYASLDGSDLTGSTLSVTTLFEGCSLKNSILNGLDIRNMNFKYAYLNNASINNAKISGTDFYNANLTGVSVRSAYAGSIRNTIFDQADMRGVDLSTVWDNEFSSFNGALLNNSTFNGILWTKSDFSNANLSGATINGTIFGLSPTDASSFYGANLDGASIHSATLSYVNLSGIRGTVTFDEFCALDHINLDWISMKNVDTSAGSLALILPAGADLTGATFKNANFNGSRNYTLSGAFLPGADFTGAVLTGVTLNDAYMNGAVLSGATMDNIDLKGSSLVGANMGGVQINGADLTCLNLQGANLNNANMVGSKIGRTNLSSAALTNTNMLNLTIQNPATCASWSPAATTLSGATVNYFTVFPDGKRHPSAFPSDSAQWTNFDPAILGTMTYSP